MLELWAYRLLGIMGLVVSFSPRPAEVPSLWFDVIGRMTMTVLILVVVADIIQEFGRIWREHRA